MNTSRVRRYIQNDIRTIVYDESVGLQYLDVRLVKIDRKIISQIEKLVKKEHVNNQDSLKDRGTEIQSLGRELMDIIRETTDVSEDEMVTVPLLKERRIRRVVFTNLNFTLIDKTFEQIL